ncbi:type IV secretory system conjugative DNA transfer family protein [Rhodococcoides corynebacterioides]|uniref:type IV secretory system conjugative DNA transfer family protein n=1 Tax=Rhodococcoides corynebacterioides TaxID=53972 RepID=UPI001C9B05FD|nr:type IV secretory system conjugative DNA transfer family protein [Rhodococcus corynebacterioides]MBY6349833.1 type IV secretory system conjugative DNA transfer family protein [Rhodococcus corynebacterioides]
MNDADLLAVLPLTIPAPLSVESARSAVIGLAGLSGQPLVVIEAIGRNHEIHWRIATPRRSRHAVAEVLTSHLPGVLIGEATDLPPGPRADVAAGLRVRANTPTGGLLAHDTTEPVTRGILGALSATNRHERCYLQIVLGPRHAPRTPDRRLRGEQRAQAGKALSDYRFQCTVRVAAAANDDQRARRLVDRVVGAIRGLNSPSAQISVKRDSTKAFDQARAPWFWSTTLSARDVVALTAWPIAKAGDPPLPGVPSPHPRLLPPLPTVPRGGRVFGVATSDAERPIAVSVRDSLSGIAVTGPTGVGKSNLLGQFALADIAAGRGVVVIDPKGDLIDDIIRRADESRLDDIAVVDATDSAPIGINSLVGTTDPDLAADTTLGVFHSLYADAWGPRTQDVLHASLLTLARRGDASIAMLPLLLTNPGFRRATVGQVARSDPMGLGGFWAWWDSLSENEQSQATAPLLRRVRPILLRPGLRAILGQRHPKFDLNDVFTKKRILLVSLEKGKIGPEAAALLGSLIVAQLWTATLARASQPAQSRVPVTILIDEVQDYLRLPGDIGDALAQARGLGVGYTLAHQHLGQLPKPIREAVTANARTRIAFQLSHPDAREFASLTSGQLEPADFEALPAFHAYAQILNQNTSGPWVSVSTTKMPDPVRSAGAVRARSRARYGQPLSDVEADLLSLTDQSSVGESIGRTKRSGRTEQNGGRS